MPTKKLLFVMCVSLWLGQLAAPTSVNAGFVSSVDGLLRDSSGGNSDQSASSSAGRSRPVDVQGVRRNLERVLGVVSDDAIPESGGQQTGGSHPANPGSGPGAPATIGGKPEMVNSSASELLALPEFVWIPPAFLSGIFRPPRAAAA